MVLKHRLAIVALIFFCASHVFACDPNFMPQEIFTAPLELSLSPAIFIFSLRLALLDDVPLPASWESIVSQGSRAEARFQKFDSQWFKLLTTGFVRLAQNLHDNLTGRVIFVASPLFINVTRDGLKTGGWQTMVAHISMPLTARVVIYEPAGRIHFIDEFDSTVNLSITLAWPPVLLKHLRVWTSNGMWFSWPEEDADLQGEEL